MSSSWLSKILMMVASTATAFDDALAERVKLLTGRCGVDAVLDATVVEVVFVAIAGQAVAVDVVLVF